MNLDALIHRKFPPITQQYEAKDTVDLQSSAIVFTARRRDLDHRQEIPPSTASLCVRTSRFVCLKSVKSPPREERHY
jgi:hypothetical protein